MSPNNSHFSPLNRIICSSDSGAKSVAEVLILTPGISVSGVKSLSDAACFITSPLRGVRFRPTSAEETFYRNLVVYGAGGLVVPFVGIKAIDLLLSIVV
jgi:hypothetical protein